MQVQVNTTAAFGENILRTTFVPSLGGIRLLQRVLAFEFCRIVFSTRGKMILLSMLFIKATFFLTVTLVASDGLSPLMEPSAVVLCLLISFGG